MINIITADDHALIRKGVRHILDKTPDIRVSAEAENGRQLLEKLHQARYDVILVDLSMPGMEAFDLLREIRILAPGSPFLVLTMHAEEHFGLQVLKAGASGYLNKSGGLSDLATAVRQVHAGKKFISPALADKLARQLLHPGDSPAHERLSEREFQVLCYIASGKTVSEIAGELGLSVKTISTYRTRLLEKMEMENNAQLTYYAIQHRLV
jgi:two-component system invasion response regulator UvrY